MGNVLGVDPGGIHVGMALFNSGECTDAWETTPSECLAYVRAALESGALEALVIESFSLFAGKAAAQTGSNMPTVELIGALKAAWAWWGDGCQLVMQQASIKKAAIRILAAKGVVSVAKRNKAGGHAFDAEVHGSFYVMRTQDTALKA